MLQAACEGWIRFVFVFAATFALVGLVGMALGTPIENTRQTPEMSGFAALALLILMLGGWAVSYGILLSPLGVPLAYAWCWLARTSSQWQGSWGSALTSTIVAACVLLVMVVSATSLDHSHDLFRQVLLTAAMVWISVFAATRRMVAILKRGSAQEETPAK